jgi:Flp pilus assembly protein TadD
MHTFHSGYDDEAVRALEKAAALKSRDENAHFALGNIYSELGRYDEAIGAYRKAVKIKPKFAEAHYHLGVAYVELSKKALSSARREYNTLKKLDKDIAQELLDKIGGKR